jgi:hypothetical protein
MNASPRISCPERLLWPAYMFFVLALSGCFWRPSGSDWTAEEQAEKVAEYAEDGYHGSAGYNIATLHERWQHGADALEVTFTAPEASGTFPLILYFPGLGETAAGGELWRNAWAAAGYAVFSMQPAELADALKGLPPPAKREKPSAWSFGETQSIDDPQAVRDSELHYLGRSYFSSQALKSRLDHVAWALHKLQVLGRDPASRFAAADLSRSVVAGYELGAQTAAALAGENIGQALPDLGAWHPQALIALSPTVDLAAGNVHARFKRLTLPLLAITGPTDDDPYGVGSASLRGALWDYATSTEKYLLLLRGAPHRLFSGSPTPSQVGEATEEEAEDENSGYSSPDDNYHGGANRGGLLQGMGMGRSSERRPDQKQLFKEMAAIRCATTAFLDAAIKSDQAARQWLNNKAPKWMGRWVELKAYRK